MIRASARNRLPNVVVAGPVLGQHLDRDRDIQVIIVAEPDGGERAGADAPKQPIPPDGFHRHHSRPNPTPANGSGTQGSRPPAKLWVDLQHTQEYG